VKFITHQRSRIHIELEMMAKIFERKGGEKDSHSEFGNVAERQRKRQTRIFWLLAFH
jgi:acyl-CoA hydrolase